MRHAKRLVCDIERYSGMRRQHPSSWKPIVPRTAEVAQVARNMTGKRGTRCLSSPPSSATDLPRVQHARHNCSNVVCPENPANITHRSILLTTRVILLNHGKTGCDGDEPARSVHHGHATESGMHRVKGHDPNSHDTKPGVLNTKRHTQGPHLTSPHALRATQPHATCPGHHQSWQRDSCVPFSIREKPMTGQLFGHLCCEDSGSATYGERDKSSSDSKSTPTPNTNAGKSWKIGSST